MSLVALENATSIRRGRLEGLLKILAVDDAVRRAGSEWEATGRGWVHDAAKWSALADVRAREADLMRSFAAGAGCLMRFLQTALDDPDPADCGRCSVCTGELPACGPRPSAATVEAARVFARGRDVVIEPRLRWPAGVGRKGAIVGCAEGRALAFADDPGWADELRSLKDGPAPDAVLSGLVEVMRRWRSSWPARPVAVVPMPSATFGRLNRSVAEHLGAVGKLPVIDALGRSGPAAPPDAASGPTVRALFDAIGLRDGVEVPQGPVLLVDAQYRTGWSVTVAASLLRSAGATLVLPLVVHRLP